jgi:DNA primase
LARLSTSRLTFLAQASEQYSKALRDSAAVPYLKTRGLSGDSAMYFRLGYVADPLPGHEKYLGHLAIPYVTRAGIVALRFRRIGDGDGPKYQSEPGEESRLYHTEGFFRHERFICLCEGEIDTMTAVQAGLPAVGVPGASSWGKYFYRAFDGYDAVYVLTDMDDKGAGLGFAEKVAGQIKSARIIPMQHDGVGHDVNSLVKKHGVDTLLSKIGVDA